MTRSDIDPARGRAAFLDAEAARRGLQRVLPAIEAAVQDRAVCGMGFLAVVVMDPAWPAPSEPDEAAFDAAILLEHALGDRSRWDADYAAFARAKARVAWRTGLGGAELALTRPHVLRPGDSLLRGAVCLAGLTVAVSGAEAPWDEAFATWIAAALRAEAQTALAAALGAGRLVAPDAARPGHG